MELRDKTIFITGATSGIGKETALALALLGGNIVFTARNEEKATKTKQEIIEKTGNQKIDFILCDLESFESIKAAAIEFRKRYSRLHILINNAGIWETKWSKSKDGIEKTFAVNHLAPFLLTNLLIDILKSSAPARIINLSSEAHRQAKFDLTDLESKHSFGVMRTYSNSKLANIYFTRELSYKLQGTGVTVNCLHPGVVNTRLFDKMNGFMKSIISVLMISPEYGAKTSIYLASSDEVENISGEYFSKCRIKKTTKEAHDIQIAEKLWNISEKYVGL